LPGSEGSRGYGFRRGQAHQVHILTVGLVVAMMLGLLTTAWLYSRDSWLSIMAASFTATVTFISAWFRILTQTGASVWAGSIPVFLVIVTAIIVLCVITIRAELARTAAHARWLTIALAITALALVPSHAAAQAEGIALAFVEVPMAALSFWVATRAMSYPAADRLGR
jgi:hypothetical protein